MCPRAESAIGSYVGLLPLHVENAQWSILIGGRRRRGGGGGWIPSGRTSQRPVETKVHLLRNIFVM